MPRPATFLQVFSSGKKFCNSFFTEHLLVAASDNYRKFGDTICYFILINRSKLSQTEKTMNRTVTWFYNRDDVNVIAAELRLLQTRLIFSSFNACLVVTKRSHILKQTWSWTLIVQLQVCVSMCDFFVTTRH